MANSARTQRKEFTALQKRLNSQRNELRSRIDRHRLDVVTDRVPDDEIATACDNATTDMAVATLERERRTLAEIESALSRMNKGEYGVCANCGVAIPKARLEALPWARVCVHCAELGFNTATLRVAS